jgi:hypothetical protein
MWAERFNFALDGYKGDGKNKERFVESKYSLMKWS